MKSKKNMFDDDPFMYKIDHSIILKNQNTIRYLDELVSGNIKMKSVQRKSMLNVKGKFELLS